MKKETYSIENGKLICEYETYKGKIGRKTFSLKNIRGGLFDFFFFFTNYFLRGVQWDNLCKCYTALYNNTKLSGFIKCDLSQLNTSS